MARAASAFPRASGAVGDPHTRWRPVHGGAFGRQSRYHWMASLRPQRLGTLWHRTKSDLWLPELPGRCRRAEATRRRRSPCSHRARPVRGSSCCRRRGWCWNSGSRRRCSPWCSQLGRSGGRGCRWCRSKCWGWPMCSWRWRWKRRACGCFSRPGSGWWPRHFACRGRCQDIGDHMGRNRQEVQGLSFCSLRVQASGFRRLADRRASYHKACDHADVGSWWVGDRSPSGLADRMQIFSLQMALLWSTRLGARCSTP